MRVLIHVPAKASRGEIIELRALAQHPMETGFRRDADGSIVPRNILTRFVCHFEGEEVFSADLHPAVAANPFLAFTLRAERSGKLAFRWIDQDGLVQVETAILTVA